VVEDRVGNRGFRHAIGVLLPGGDAGGDGYAAGQAHPCGEVVHRSALDGAVDRDSAVLLEDHRREGGRRVVAPGLHGDVEVEEKTVGLDALGGGSGAAHTPV